MFQVSASIEGVKALKNNSLKIVIETQDIKLFKPDELAKLFELNNKQIQVAFKEGTINLEDVKDYKPIEKDEKTPSKRLRSVLYILWQKLGGKGDSDSFYKNKVESYIEQEKAKINELNY